MGIAQVLLRWDPNPEQAPGLTNLEYHVKINAPWPDDYETGTTQSTFAVPLHQGLSASVQTILQGGPLPLASSWVSAELPAPPGSPGTSVTNLTCITNTVAGHTHRRPYQVSLRCSWRAGAAAPGDTRYSLYYRRLTRVPCRYGPWTEECREYSTDETRRNTACWFPKTSISSKGHDWLAVRVNGSSRRAAIRPLDRLFAVQAIARANPPANVTAQIQGTHLSIQWDKPFSAFPHHCFDYEVKIYNTKKDYLQMERISSNAFLSVVDAVAEYSVQVRAAVSAACRASGLWSPWSRPVHVGESPAFLSGGLALGVHPELGDAWVPEWFCNSGHPVFHILPLLSQKGGFPEASQGQVGDLVPGPEPFSGLLPVLWVFLPLEFSLPTSIRIFKPFKLMGESQAVQRRS
ncbi:Interleukin-5 receptor subunit alpha [Sciurus carolinensis]|uniref:Interleukin-5 receptor subunit alpha n=1 Tax=Sciurus carolinensis TaxID=30640 RepID=A0AA41T8L0_SCICA|nr:Interleukin-5 receptor subunit alpha [Sciurus carolinensis]